MGTRQKSRLPGVLLAFAPLHRLAMGVALGVVLGGLIFLATVALLLKDGYPVGPNLALLSQFLLGYHVSITGSIIGLCWGFAIGFALGWGFALVRNAFFWVWLALVRSRVEMERYGDLLDHL